MTQINNSEILMYQTDDGNTKLQVQIEEETVWLSQNQMAELFETTKQNISLHIHNLFEEKELQNQTTVKDFLTVQQEGKIEKKRSVIHYNLDVIISVGYRVKSLRGTQFRIWATQRLREYIIKGFTLDDERLKEGGNKARYFKELLQRIRDIRSSERNFYQLITDIYVTSIDYRKDTEVTKKFFATVQNKIHYAVHGHTAAEIIKQRVNSEKPLMGLTNFKGNYITTEDVTIAKNYLSEDELEKLNLLVSMFLDFAELQALRRKPMSMADWSVKLDQFIKTAEHMVLENAGSVSAKEAEKIAKLEYKRYRKGQDKNYICDFDREIKKIIQKENLS